MTFASRTVVSATVAADRAFPAAVDELGSLGYTVATIQTAWKKTDGPVRYHGGQPEVRLGDRVEVRGLFRKRRGIINYVPGISPIHGEMEHNALYWVGISFERGDFTGILVDPDTGCTLKKLVFLERGAADAAAPLPPEPFE